jgi:hypothetical protein
VPDQFIWTNGKAEAFVFAHDGKGTLSLSPGVRRSA